MIDNQKIETDIDNSSLRDIAPGFIRFGVKAPDTMENMQIHAAFKDFCRVETDNNYTLGLKMLLEYWTSDAKISTIFNMLQEQNVALQDLKSSVIELQKQPKKVVSEDDNDTF